MRQTALRDEPEASDYPAHENDGDLRQGARNQRGDDRRRDSHARPRAVGTQRTAHAPKRLGDNGDGHDLQAMQPHMVRARVQALPHAECDHGQGRRQREAEPRQQGAGQSALQQAQRDPDLAAGRSGQELAKRHQIGEGALVQPSPARDEFGAKIAEMGDRPAKARGAELQKYQKDRKRIQRPAPFAYMWSVSDYMS